MTTGEAGAPAPHDDRTVDSTGDSIGSLFSRLRDDAEAMVRAYLALYKAQALWRFDEAKFGLAMGVVSLVLVNATLIALLVGMMMVLQHHIGTGWAVMAVIGGALVLAAILAWLAVSGLRKAFGGSK